MKKTDVIANKRRLEKLEGPSSSLEDRQGRVGPPPRVKWHKHDECVTCTQISTTKLTPLKKMLVSSSHVGNMADEMRF